MNAGDADTALAAFQQDPGSEARWQPLPDFANLPGALRERVVTAFRPSLETNDPLEALARLQQFRILCALRRGPFGVENLNAIAEEILIKASLLSPRPAGFYRGQPITVTENNYNLGLFNGDSGIILPDPDDGSELRAFFVSAEGRLRRFLPSRLPRHETAFAMTVHKSQGSEFAAVLLILPDTDAPILTRELLYTGLTRARAQVEIWAPEMVLRAAISRRVTRASGLREQRNNLLFLLPFSAAPTTGSRNPPRRLNAP